MEIIYASHFKHNFVITTMRTRKHIEILDTLFRDILKQFEGVRSDRRAGDVYIASQLSLLEAKLNAISDYLKIDFKHKKGKPSRIVRGTPDTILAVKRK